MKMKVHNASIHPLTVTATHEGVEMQATVECVHVEFVAVPEYGKSYTHVVLPTNEEAVASIVARFPVDAVFEIEPAAVA